MSTDRNQVVTSVAASAWTRVQREADANGEQVWQATRETVRQAVEDAASSDSRVEQWNWAHFATATVKQVEQFANVRSGTWA